MKIFNMVEIVGVSLILVLAPTFLWQRGWSLISVVFGVVVFSGFLWCGYVWRLSQQNIQSKRLLVLAITLIMYIAFIVCTWFR